MIAPTCIRCKEELDDFGGILLSPPDDQDRVTKYHLCGPCFDVVLPMRQRSWTVPQIQVAPIDTCSLRWWLEHR